MFFLTDLKSTCWTLQNSDEGRCQTPNRNTKHSSYKLPKAKQACTRMFGISCHQGESSVVPEAFILVPMLSKIDRHLASVGVGALCSAHFQKYFERSTVFLLELHLEWEHVITPFQQWDIKSCRCQLVPACQDIKKNEKKIVQIKYICRNVA